MSSFELGTCLDYTVNISLFDTFMLTAHLSSLPVWRFVACWCSFLLFICYLWQKKGSVCPLLFFHLLHLKLWVYGRSVKFIVVWVSYPRFLDDIPLEFCRTVCAKRLLFGPFLVKMIPHCLNNVEALGRIHPSIRPAATDFQSRNEDTMMRLLEEDKKCH